MNVNYSIATIDEPAPSNTGYTVNVELKTPANEFIKLTTRHENGSNNVQGTYNDSARGLVVYVDAHCSSDQCLKYTLLVTTVKNNQKVYQEFAVSYKNDCTYSVKRNSASYGQFYSGIDAAESDNSNITPLNDIQNCPKPN